MPHKRNPVLTENLTGIARIVRAAVVPALENVALWHERDISHSSVERVFAPDATIGLDFALHRLAGVIENLLIYPETMQANLDKLVKIGLHCLRIDQQVFNHASQTVKRKIKPDGGIRGENTLNR